MLSRFIRRLKNRVFKQERKPEEVIETDLSWIWQPFETSGNLGFSSRVKKIAAAIIESSADDIPTIPLERDPRLVIPLCAIQLQNEINLTRLSSFKNELKSVSIKYLDAQKEFIDRVLSKITPKERWRYLFESLTPELQFALLYRLIDYRCPTKNDWRNLFKELKYDFSKGWQYRTVLIIAFVISLVALSGIILVIARQPLNWVSGLLGLFFWIIFAFWGTLWQGIEERLEPKIFTRLGLLGLPTFATELGRLFNQNLIWEGILPLSKAVPTTVAASVVIVVIVVGVITGAGTVTVPIAVALAGVMAGAVAGSSSVAIGIILVIALTLFVAGTVVGTLAVVGCLAVVVVLTLLKAEIRIQNLVLAFVGLVAGLVAGVIAGNGSAIDGVGTAIGATVGAGIGSLAKILIIAGTGYGQIARAVFGALLIVSFVALLVALVSILVGANTIFVAGLVVCVLAIMFLWVIQQATLRGNGTERRKSVLVAGATGAWVVTGFVLADGPTTEAIVGSGSVAIALTGFVSAPKVTAAAVAVGMAALAGSVPGINTTVIATVVGIGSGVVAGIGLRVWSPASETQNFPLFLAALSFPWFCWFPLTFVFATATVMDFFSWQWGQISLFWLAVLGSCSLLWWWGQKEDYAARNPLRGILDG